MQTDRYTRFYDETGGRGDGLPEVSRTLRIRRPVEFTVRVPPAAEPVVDKPLRTGVSERIKKLVDRRNELEGENISLRAECERLRRLLAAHDLDRVERANLGQIPARLIYPPAEAVQLLGISHATLYRLIGVGKLTAVKIGSRTGITRESIEGLCGDVADLSLVNAVNMNAVKTRQI